MTVNVGNLNNVFNGQKNMQYSLVQKRMKNKTKSHSDKHHDAIVIHETSHIHISKQGLNTSRDLCALNRLNFLTLSYI